MVSRMCSSPRKHTSPFNDGISLWEDAQPTTGSKLCILLRLTPRYILAYVHVHCIYHTYYMYGVYSSFRPYTCRRMQCLLQV